MDVAARIKIARDFHKFRLQLALQRAVNFIYTILVADVAIHEGIYVNFNCLKLHYELIRDVFQIDRRKVRIARARAAAAKLGQGDFYQIIALLFIGPNF